MSLRDQFASDLAVVFINTGEFATNREFRIINESGGFIVFNADVVWDEESAKQQPVVARQGVYLGDVVCFMEHKYLPRAPVAGEIIYSPANKSWEVMQCVDEEGCYKLSLAAQRSQPGYYNG